MCSCSVSEGTGILILDIALLIAVAARFAADRPAGHAGGFAARDELGPAAARDPDAPDIRAPVRLADAGVPGADSLYDQLKQRFAGQGSSNTSNNNL